MRTVREAAAALGIDGNTLRDWIKKAGAGDRLERDPVDARLVYVPDDILAQLAEAHKRPLVQQSADLAAILRRLDAVEAALAALSAKSERANRRYPPLDVPGSEAPESAHRRAPRGTADASPDPAVSSIADGWIRAATFAKTIGVHENTFTNWIRNGAVAVTRRPDASRSDDRDEIWLTPEQQAAALEVARQRGHIS